MNVEGVVPKSRLDEFRNNNINLAKERDTLKAELEKFKNIDPEKCAEATKKLQAIEEKKLIEAGQLDEVVKQRTERMKIDFENQLKAIQKAHNADKERLKALTERLATVTIDNEVTKVVSELSTPRKGAMTDIMARARSMFALDENGNPVAKDSDGQQVYGKEGQPLTIKEWAGELVQNAPFLFEPSQGSGAQGGEQSRTLDGKTISASARSDGAFSVAEQIGDCFSED